MHQMSLEMRSVLLFFCFHFLFVFCLFLNFKKARILKSHVARLRTVPSFFLRNGSGLVSNKGRNGFPNPLSHRLWCGFSQEWDYPPLFEYKRQVWRGGAKRGASAGVSKKIQKNSLPDKEEQGSLTWVEYGNRLSLCFCSADFWRGAKQGPEGEGGHIAHFWWI